MAKPKAPTKAMFAAIGRVSAECAAVEALYRDLFSLLINSTYGYVITSGEDLSTLTLMCRRVSPGSITNSPTNTSSNWLNSFEQPRFSARSATSWCMPVGSVSASRASTEV